MAPHTPNPQPSAPNASTPLKCLICFSTIEGAHFPWCSFKMRAELDARLWRQARKEAAQELRRRSKAQASAAQRANPLLDIPEPIDVGAENVAMAELFDFDAASGNRHVVLATTSVLPALQGQEDVVHKLTLAGHASKVTADVSQLNNNEMVKALQRERVNQQRASGDVYIDRIELHNVIKALGRRAKVDEEAKQASNIPESAAGNSPFLSSQNSMERKGMGKRRRSIGEEDIEAQPALKKSSSSLDMSSTISRECHSESDEIVESPNQLGSCLESLSSLKAEMSASADEGSVTGEDQSNTVSVEEQEENEGENEDEDEAGEVEEDEDQEDDEQLLERLQQHARERKVSWKGWSVGKLSQNVSETFEETFSKSLAIFENVDVGSRRMTRKAVKDAQSSVKPVD